MSNTNVTISTKKLNSFAAAALNLSGTFVVEGPGRPWGKAKDMDTLKIRCKEGVDGETKEPLVKGSYRTISCSGYYRALQVGKLLGKDSIYVSVEGDNTTFIAGNEFEISVDPKFRTTITKPSNDAKPVKKEMTNEEKLAAFEAMQKEGE